MNLTAVTQPLLSLYCIYFLGPAVCRPGVKFAKQGDSATITCNATNVPRENITCSTKGVRDPQEVAGCYEISVKDVSLSDVGYYSCDASAIVNETNVDLCYLQVICKFYFSYLIIVWKNM